MVGGVVYVRGDAGEYARGDAELQELDAADIAYLDGGMDDFLNAVGRPELRAELSVWKQWRKLRPASPGGRERIPVSHMAEFRTEHWVRGGIFSDVFKDDFTVNPLVVRGACRQRVPSGTTSGARLPANSTAPPPFRPSAATTCCGRDGWTRPADWCFSSRPSLVRFAAAYAPTRAWMPAVAGGSTSRCR